MRKNQQTFTHFLSLPFISQESRELLKKYQHRVTGCFIPQQREVLKENNPNLFHITLSMLTLNSNESKMKAKDILKRLTPEIKELLTGVSVSFSKMHYFQARHSKPLENLTVLYVDIVEDAAYDRILKCANILIREFVKEQIIHMQDFKAMNLLYDDRQGTYRPEKMHLTMFRVDRDSKVKVDWKEAFEQIEKFTIEKAFPLQSVDVSTRFDYDKTKFYTPLQRVSLDHK